MGTAYAWVRGFKDTYLSHACHRSTMYHSPTGLAVLSCRDSITSTADFQQPGTSSICTTTVKQTVCTTTGGCTCTCYANATDCVQPVGMIRKSLSLPASPARWHLGGEVNPRKNHSCQHTTQLSPEKRLRQGEHGYGKGDGRSVHVATHQFVARCTLPGIAMAAVNISWSCALFSVNANAADLRDVSLFGTSRLSNLAAKWRSPATRMRPLAQAQH